MIKVKERKLLVTLSGGFTLFFLSSEYMCKCVYPHTHIKRNRNIGNIVKIPSFHISLLSV